MSKRTFILNLGEQDKDLVDNYDIISVITIRVVEIYLDITKKPEVSVEFLSAAKAFVEKNLISINPYLYSVDIDFEKDLIV